MSAANSLIDADIRLQFRNLRSTVLDQFSIEDIQTLDKVELLHLQALLGHGSDWGVWQTPRQWFPSGFNAGWNARIKDRIVGLLEKILVDHPEYSQNLTLTLSSLIEGAVLSCIRYCILCRIGPVSRSNGRDSLDPSVIAQLAYAHLPIIASASIAKAVAFQGDCDKSKRPQLQKVIERGLCFGRLEWEDIDALHYSQSYKQTIKAELRRMHACSQRGLWRDSPDLSVDIKEVTSVKGVRQAEEPELLSLPHLPLPDEFVGEIGKKSNWLIENLGPNLLRILTDFQAVWEDAAHVGLDPRTLSEKCQKYLRHFSWIDVGGNPIEAIPFELRLNQRGSQSKKQVNVSKTSHSEKFSQGDHLNRSASWPPRGAAQIFGLARLLQGAHLFVIGLSTGSRNGETLEMERSCVQRAPNGIPFACGRTFKLVRRHEGELREWPLPALAEAAFDQQEKLVSLMERLCPLGMRNTIVKPSTVPRGRGLWFTSNDRSGQATSALLQAVLRNYVAHLGMNTMPGGQAIRPHRLRKTLARMVALAIVQAPKILQDVFGHKSIEMTLYYILADKNLAAEIDEIVRELRVMRCAEVVSSIVESERNSIQADTKRVSGKQKVGSEVGNRFGGKAAASLYRAVNEYGRELHRTSQEWGVQSIRQLAQILTIGGTTWDLVRPGVLCTKAIGQYGPCNKKRGYPDPSSCQTSCEYRLEESWLREDVERCLSDSIEHWERETEAGQDLVAEFWAGQVRTHIERFSDLKSRWMQDQRVRVLVEPKT